MTGRIEIAIKCRKNMYLGFEGSVGQPREGRGDTAVVETIWNCFLSRRGGAGGKVTFEPPACGIRTVFCSSDSIILPWGLSYSHTISHDSLWGAIWPCYHVEPPPGLRVTFQISAPSFRSVLPEPQTWKVYKRASGLSFPTVASSGHYFNLKVTSFSFFEISLLPQKSSQLLFSAPVFWNNIFFINFFV